VTDCRCCVLIGLLHIVKLPHMNALTSADIDTADLAFKVRRKRFTIEVPVTASVCLTVKPLMFARSLFLDFSKVNKIIKLKGNLSN